MSLNTQLTSREIESLRAAQSVTREICSDLFSGGMIQYFDYHRYYHKGEMLAYSTNASIFQPFIENAIYPTLEEQRIQEATGNAVVFLSNAMLLPAGAASKEPEKFISNILLAFQLNIYHRMYFLTYEKDYVLVTGFGVDSNSQKIFEYYMNNIDFLKSFTLYFESAIDKRINKKENNRIILPNYTNFKVHHDEKSKKIQKIFSGISNKKIDLTALTEREFQCFYLKSQRWSAKEISVKLHISSRTVEKHLSNISEKLDPLLRKMSASLFSEFPCLESYF